MNYKDTIQLPETNFSMKGNLIKKEPETQEIWNGENLYSKIDCQGHQQKVCQVVPWRFEG